jgi:hypothetical protein
MLTTAYKARLPRGWSWPIGTETVSEWLEGVEGAAQRALAFSDYHIRNSHFRQIRDQGLPYPILSISYSRPITASEAENLAQRGLADQWTVRVDPIPSIHRKLVHTCLASSGLPKMRTWLEATRRNAASQGRGFCRVLFQESSLRVLFEQRFNDFDDALQAEITDKCINRTG